jgi:hypothetical protein
MLLLILRETALMPALLVIHLATVLALRLGALRQIAHFVIASALVQNRLESRRDTLTRDPMPGPQPACRPSLQARRT